MHVLAGVAACLALIGWQIGSGRAGRLENVALYWHFVNLVGIILFPLFYLF
jgi:heme/copper-type cytochrome/quinol oxidase subunit 3